MTLNTEMYRGAKVSTGPGSRAPEGVVDDFSNGATLETNVMLDLLREVGKKVGSAPTLKNLIKQMTQMTQCTLGAVASSILLLDEAKQNLLFEVAEGESEEVLKQVKLSTQIGIAGWVARHRKPLIVNDVTRDAHFVGHVDKITGFDTKSVICAPLIVHRELIGVIEVLNKLDGSGFTEQDLDTLTAVASTAAMAIENTKLHQSVVDAYKSTIKALAAAIDAKDHYTCGHSQRVMEYALLGGDSLALPAEELEVLEYAGTLHDIGKIGVTDNILCKPGLLTDEEWVIIRQHPDIGYNILRNIPFLEKTKMLILHHHERYDGTGYPGGLKGEDIPIGARILAVADAFDTMTTDRSYRPALGIDSAFKELYACSGLQFCPVAVEVFVSGYNNSLKKTYGINFRTFRKLP
jgi:HD-GYP domain-containing protein (c-di-GMP phosphodiesterase class II)